jgi:hypothetical protein
MNPNTKLFVTSRGSILMRGGVLKSPGDFVLAGEFKGLEANLQELLRVGALSLESGRVAKLGERAIDGNRVEASDLAAPLADEIDLKTGAGVPRGQQGQHDGATLQRVKEIRAAQLAREQAEAERQAKLRQLSGADLTAAEAKELGVIGG